MSTARLAIVGQDAGHAPPPAGPVLLQTAFRPFFLLAAGGAALLVPAWLVMLTGALPVRPGLGPLAWHAHEMIFGFSMAVVAGFVLTAAMVWTGHVTVRGRWLGALVGLWVLGRALVLLGPAALVPAAVVNVAFPLGVAAGIAGPILEARSKRNYGFLPLLEVMAGCEAAIFAEALGYGAGLRGPAQWVALHGVLAMVAVVGGRIIPMFTRNATGFEIRARGLRDDAALVTACLPMLLYVLPLPRPVVGGALLLAGGLNLARMWGWGTTRALKNPFVGILHLGYLGLAVGLLVEGAATFTTIASQHPGRHVLALGGIALICLGMMTRVALGHTGRPLHPPRGNTALYGLLAASVLARAASTFVTEPALLWASGLLFSVAFAGYIGLYAGILVSPRADGKPG